MEESQIVSYLDSEEDDEVLPTKQLKMEYNPSGLKKVFEHKLNELMPVLKVKTDEQKLLYALERL